jgi:hypothetical protein
VDGGGDNKRDIKRQMNNTNQNILNVSLFFAIIVCFTIGAIAYTPVLIIYFLGVLATLTIFKIGNKDQKEFVDTVTIFLSSLFFGFLLAFMVNMDFLQEGMTFLYPDQIHFFEEARTIALSSSSFNDVITQSFNGVYIEYKIVYFIFGSLCYLEKLTNGSINFLPLLYSVVYVTAFIPVLLYHIIKLYLPRLISLKSSLFYGLLTPIMAYSGYLLRDMHVTLITMIALFLMVRKITIVRVLGIALLIPIMSGFRLSNSLLILAMLGIFIFASKSSKTIKGIFILFGIGFLIFFSGDILNVILSTESRLDNYEVFTAERLEGSSGLGKRLYNLPPVVKEISIILFTLSAFPFIANITTTLSLSQFFMILYNSITNIGWFFIFFGVIYFIKPIYKRILKMPNKIFLYLLVLFVLYMFINTSNMTFRRLICVFPFIYIPFLLVYNDMSKEKRTTYKRLAFFAGVSLYVVYFFLLI